MDLAIFLSACLIAGLVAGYIGGLLGVGGGTIIVPVLIFLFERFDLFATNQFPENISVITAIGTSLATIIFTNGAASIVQIRSRMVEWKIVQLWSPFLLGGSFTAGYIAHYLPSAVLKLFIAGFLFSVAYLMWSNWKPISHLRPPGRLISAAIASITGIIASLAGIGGGNIVVPTLLFFNTPIARATATSSVLGLVIAFSGVYGYVLSGLSLQIEFTLGYVYLPALAAIALTTVIASPLGVLTAHRIRPMPLRRIFGSLMIFVAVQMTYSGLSSII